MKFTFYVTVLREARRAEDTNTGHHFFKIPGPVRGRTVSPGRYLAPFVVGLVTLSPGRRSTPNWAMSKRRL